MASLPRVCRTFSCVSFSRGLEKTHRRLLGEFSTPQSSRETHSLLSTHWIFAAVTVAILSPPPLNEAILKLETEKPSDEWQQKVSRKAHTSWAAVRDGMCGYHIFPFFAHTFLLLDYICVEHRESRRCVTLALWCELDGVEQISGMWYVTAFVGKNECVPLFYNTWVDGWARKKRAQATWISGTSSSSFNRLPNLGRCLYFLERCRSIV